MHVESYKVVNDDRKPVMVQHKNICYPEAIHQELVEKSDTSFPGVLIDFGNGYYLLEDGCHRIAKFQQWGIFESLFYVVTIQEYKDGMVDMIYGDKRVTLGEWNHNALDPIPHSM